MQSTTFALPFTIYLFLDHLEPYRVADPDGSQQRILTPTSSLFQSTDLLESAQQVLLVVSIATPPPVRMFEGKHSAGRGGAGSRHASVPPTPTSADRCSLVDNPAAWGHGCTISGLDGASVMACGSCKDLRDWIIDQKPQLLEVLQLIEALSDAKDADRKRSTRTMGTTAIVLSIDNAWARKCTSSPTARQWWEFGLLRPLANTHRPRDSPPTNTATSCTDSSPASPASPTFLPPAIPPTPLPLPPPPPPPPLPPSLPQPPLAPPLTCQLLRLTHQG
ncbi:hypothetical protein E2C01_012823 [Portunus trituberculatus]|uniref:Uncharacterized protein n=1 Tax=Portunus trituberculatus TaxID=210409 RepID=A0A5B7DEM3_PORTR|nr:hypothetical protein [Portunus trituberculatus]